MSPRVLLACAVLLGCDAQATEQYSGEPLLRVRGRVELLQARADGASLQPALAFRGGDGNFRLIDVDVQGAFPAEFVMDVLEPPPDESLQTVEDSPSGPRIAVGYITAVAPDLPRVFTYADVEGAGTIHTSDGGMQWACDSRMDSCFYDSLEQTDAGTRTVRTTCPSLDADAGTCTTSYPEPEQPIWASFAGLSQNYLVVYLEAAATAGSYFARAFGDSRRAVSAGYHLIGLREETADETEMRHACHAAALVLALERLNAEHGTQFVEADFERFCAPEDTGCAGHHERELARRDLQARDELGCRDGETVLTRIEQPETERITVRIGPEVAPL